MRCAVIIRQRLLKCINMLDLIFWAKLPLHLGFPTIAKPLMTLKTTVDTLQSKLEKVKEHLDELSRREDYDIIVLKSYETEIDLIAIQVIQTRHSLIKASIDFASQKLSEAHQALLQDCETVNEIRLKKLTIICRTLLKQLLAQLKAGLDEDEEKWVRGFLEVVANCVHEIYRHQELRIEGLTREDYEWLNSKKRRTESVTC
mmetsp:Transcript_10571/g.20357  ORF Transcript_10571/g.20357 Transcript_10571/m.20357 type:complete len:202 (+) Transcript_10571:4875-5480(+)